MPHPMGKTMNQTIAIIGLGYMGLPRAVAFGEQLPTLGFDINAKRLADLKRDIDHTLECSAQELKTPSIYSTSNATFGVSEIHPVHALGPNPSACALVDEQRGRCASQ